MLWSRLQILNGFGARRLVACAFVAILGVMPCSAQCVPDWDPALGMAGPNGDVHAIAVFDSGSGPELYVGGAFTAIGGVAAPSGLARYDGAQWAPVGSGVLDGGTIRALEVFDDGGGERLFIGGEFLGAGGSSISLITAFDGSSFDSLGGGVTGTSVLDLALHDPGTGPQLYACGAFTQAGGVSAVALATWSGVAWSAVGDNTLVGTVHTIITHDLQDGAGAMLWYGGAFTSTTFPAGSNFGFLVEFELGAVSGFDGPVYTLESSPDGGLYVGGDFTTVELGFAAQRIARFYDTGWEELSLPGEGPNAAVRSIVRTTISGSSAFLIGGDFTTVSGNPFARVVAYQGSYQAVGSGASAPVHTLLDVPVGFSPIPPGVYTGGAFTSIDGASASRLARYENCVQPSVLFERGDANGDGGVDIADAISILDFLFGSSGTVPGCREALEVNDDGTIDIADPISLLTYLFQAGSPPPPPPFGGCGADLDGDFVDCQVETPGC